MYGLGHYWRWYIWYSWEVCSTTKVWLQTHRARYLMVDCRNCKHNRFPRCLVNDLVFKLRWKYFNDNTDELPDEDNLWEETYQEAMVKKQNCYGFSGRRSAGVINLSDTFSNTPFSDLQNRYLRLLSCIYTQTEVLYTIVDPKLRNTTGSTVMEVKQCWNYIIGKCCSVLFENLRLIPSCAGDANITRGLTGLRQLVIIRIQMLYVENR